MKYYIIKDGLTTHCVMWDGASPWECPWEYDLLLPETEWSAEQYPYPMVEIPVIEEVEDKKIVVSEFMPAVEAFLEGKEEVTVSETVQAINDYAEGL